MLAGGDQRGNKVIVRRVELLGILLHGWGRRNEERRRLIGSHHHELFFCLLVSPPWLSIVHAVLVQFLGDFKL